MIREMPPFLARIEEAIAKVEKCSAAELVVAVTPWSGSYRDADLLGGILAGLGALGLILFGPWVVHAGWVIPDVLLSGLAGWALSARFAIVRRRLCTAGRRRRQVSAEAARAFFEEEIGATRDHSGVMLFLSLGEEEARILPDHGVLQRIPLEEWRHLEQDLGAALGRPGWLDRLLGTISRAGALLGERFPVREDDVDELPNTVRIRP